MGFQSRYLKNAPNLALAYSVFMTDGIFLSSDLLIIPAKICRDLIKGIADVISAIKHTLAISS